MTCVGNHMNTIGLCWLLGSWLAFFIMGRNDGKKAERSRMGK